MELKDEELVEELRKRLRAKDLALSDLKGATKNLTNVNKKLQDSEQLKSNFLSNIRNEINNPLTTLVNLSGELADLHSCEEKKFRSLATMLHSEALYLDFQMRNILTAADLEAGEVVLNITKVDINSLIDDCINTCAPLIDEKNISIKKDGPEEIWSNSDYDKLHIAILNILSNAIVFNRDNGFIEVAYGKKGNKIFCSVKDEGIGIKKSDQTIIFDQFKQLDAGMRKQYRGHGLGLSVVKAVSDFLNGEIKVSSKSGKGSTFTITVPDRSEDEVEGFSMDGMELFVDDSGDEDQEF